MDALTARLNKRSSFASAVAELTGLVLAGESPELLEVAARRVLLLLQTRHTDRGFWTQGAALFQALRARTGTGTSMGFVEAALARCSEELRDEDDAQPVERQARGVLFEGQLGIRESAAAAPTPLALVLGLTDDAGLEAALQASLLQQQRSGPPPASRDAVRALKVETLSAEKVAQLGEGTRCAVCQETFSVGDDAQVLPCSDAHAFHPPCLAPWLLEHNSCPSCRFELPTDDWRYEARKERAAEEAEDARGAANALRGAEHAYL